MVPLCSRRHHRRWAGVVAVGRYADMAPSHIALARGMVDGWGGCSAADIERFAREEGDDPMELAARLLSGALEHMSVLLEVIDDGTVHRPE